MYHEVAIERKNGLGLPHPPTCLRFPYVDLCTLYKYGKLVKYQSNWGCRHSRVVTFTAIRLRGPGFKPRPRQKFENENFCFRRTPAVVKACHLCRVRPIKMPLPVYKT